VTLRQRLQRFPETVDFAARADGVGVVASTGDLTIGAGCDLQLVAYLERVDCSSAGSCAVAVVGLTHSATAELGLEGKASVPIPAAETEDVARSSPQTFWEIL
jgi:hypothetical protein